jgi:hypothetical protein
MALWPYALGAVALGAGAYFFWPGGKEEGAAGGTEEGAAAQPPDQGPGDTPEAPETGAEASNTPVDVPNSPAPSTPARSRFHPGPYILPQAGSVIATQGKAVPAAQALLRLFTERGVPTAATAGVLHFQRMHNSDPMAIRLAGRLPRTGVYDARTSATLTMYTGRPIPASPNAPPPPAPAFRHIINPNMVGNAAMAGFNLGVDLRRRGIMHDEPQRRLIREYQRGINRDPMFPGYAWARGSRRLFTRRIPENGRYSPEVARALRIQTPHAPTA